MILTNSNQSERLLKLPDVIGDRKRGIVGLIPMSKSKAYSMIKAGQFPAPVHLGCGSFFKLSEIQKVIDSAASIGGQR